MADDQTLNIDQGAYWSQEILWEDSNGDPVNLTGYTARMQIRKRVTDASAVIELTTTNGRITLGGAAGTILLTIAAADTAALPATPTDKRWFYDLELVPAGGQVVRLLQGRVLVSPEVTR
jgi:hypothetical protein